MNLTAMFGLSLSTLNATVSQRSETEESYSCFGPSFSIELKSLKTSTS